MQAIPRPLRDEILLASIDKSETRSGSLYAASDGRDVERASDENNDAVDGVTITQLHVEW